MNTSVVGPQLRLHPSRAVPLYYSLALAIEEAIHERRIGIDDTLETVAVLHDRLNMAPGTVRRAFRHLEQRGIVERNSRSTFKVVASPTSGSLGATTCKDLS
ncbi:GntR family transcriptional regulator [Rhodococcoides fascians]|uniref:GntR family transcriptional regulator n=1 Tax=Rhodococcoides fascians TaxID=1828 RepID=UPI0014827A90|nr:MULTISPECIES: GntR family transcriptional regulator [Rhodococcus]